MNKKIILPFVVLMVLAMVGAASALTTADEVKIRGTIVEAFPDDTGAGTHECNITVAGSGAVPGDGRFNSTGYSWNPYNYAAFWYDLDDDLSTEYLNITALKSGDNRTIEEKNLT